MQGVPADICERGLQRGPLVLDAGSGGEVAGVTCSSVLGLSEWACGGERGEAATAAAVVRGARALWLLSQWMFPLDSCKRADSACRSLARPQKLSAGSTAAPAHLAGSGVQPAARPHLPMAPEEDEPAELSLGASGDSWGSSGTTQKVLPRLRRRALKLGKLLKCQPLSAATRRHSGRAWVYSAKIWLPALHCQLVTTTDKCPRTYAAHCMAQCSVHPVCLSAIALAPLNCNRRCWRCCAQALGPAFSQARSAGCGRGGVGARSAGLGRNAGSTMRKTSQTGKHDWGATNCPGGCQPSPNRL